MPNFLVIGAARSGTTYLWGLLRSHPDIFMPRLKEPQYFSERYARPEWYASLFRQASPHQMTGEASTSYLIHPRAAERIYQHNPNMKLLCVLRHPVQRAWSHYTRAIETRGERRPFFEASSSRASADDNQYDPGNYIDGSRYAKHLDRYLRIFPRSQVFAMRSDDLFQRPLSAIERIQRFLRVPEVPPNPDRPRNASRPPTSKTLQAWASKHLKPPSPREGKGTLQRALRVRCWTLVDTLNHINRATLPTIDTEIAQPLAQALSPDIRQLEALLGWDLSDWIS